MFFASLGVAAITGAANLIVNDITRKKGLASEANDTIRDYNELVRQQQERVRGFTGNVERSYGSDFLSKLQEGKSMGELVSSIGSSTALGKNLQLMESRADQMVQNAQSSVQEAGLIAGMQGQSNLTQALAQEIAGMQASGQAASAQATSGIRSDRGTGGNIVQMQGQQNDLATRNLEQQIAMQNRSTIYKMQDTHRTASQEAEYLRRQREISAQQAVENALNDYANFGTEMRDMDTSQQNLKERVDDLTEESGAFARNVTEIYDEDTVSADDFKFIDD